MFKFKPSRQYLALLALFFLPCLVIVVTMPIDLLLKAGLCFLVAIYGGKLLWEQGLLKGNRVILGLQALEGKNWLLETQNGTQQGELLGDSTLTTWFMVLRFKLPGSRFASSAVVFRDALEGDGFYQLKLRARSSR